MSIIKSFSVGNGDMYYIKHGNKNFTIIDCCLSDDDRGDIVDELEREKKGKDITRFISTHPDGDHIQQLHYLEDRLSILNFYCVKNQATKDPETDGFKEYKKLRDSEKAFFIEKGCKRKWMNQDGPADSGVNYGCSGIHFLWPDPDDQDYQNELQNAAEGTAYNNISCIVEYSLNGGVTVIWMGDLETDFMNRIVDQVDLPKANIVFAPHHGRKTGRMPDAWVQALNPDIIVMGEANSNDSDYAAYPHHNKIRQNSAWDITFECVSGKVHCYSSNPNYSVDFLDDEGQSTFDYYLGTLNL